MTGIIDPASYEAWYHTPRGHWIGDHEFALLEHLLKPEKGASLLDVGCGTGYFCRRFARSGLTVTGIDPNTEALDFAKQQNKKQGDKITYLQGNAKGLPFSDNSFDYSSAITSFCFIDDPRQALQEMWRVTRNALILGLLNRQSLLYRQKHGHGGYQGARWVKADVVLKEWIPTLPTTPKTITTRSAIFFPQGNRIARFSEQFIPKQLPFGGFLAIYLRKKQGQAHE